MENNSVGSKGARVCCDRLKILENLNSMRRAGDLCDVILSTKGVKFSAHRAVLAAQSPFFKAMFTTPMIESQQWEVSLQDTEPEILELMLKYIYSSVVITNSNAESLLSAASFFLIDQLREEVCLFLKSQMDSTNCLGMWEIAESHSCSDLVEEARNYALKNFEDVCLRDEFTMLPRDKLIELFASDDLVVTREETVMSSALRWLNINHDERKEDFHMVLQQVRLAELNPWYVQKNVVKIPPVKSSAECMKLVEEARHYLLFPEERHLLQSCSFERRKCFSTKKGIVLVGRSTEGTSSMNLYSPSTGEWEKLGSHPVSKRSFNIVRVDECTLYVAGGTCHNFVPSQRAWRYNPQSNSWLEIASMSLGRKYPALAAFYGYIYAVGGEGSSLTSWLTSVERYSPRSNTWSAVKPMPEAVARPIVVAYKGILYVLGFNQLIQRYNYSTDTWDELESAMPDKGAIGACLVEGRIFVFGIHNTLSSYVIEKDKWEVREAARGIGTYNFRMCSFEGRIYVFWNSASSVVHVACYDPSTNKWEKQKSWPLRRNKILCCTPLH